MAVNTRTVTVLVYLPDGAPWPGQTVRYTLRGDSYTAGGTVVERTVTAVTDTLGLAEATLWTNAEGLLPCEYGYTLPDGHSGVFVLPAGDTPISLEELRALTAVGGTWAQTVLADLMEVYRAMLAAITGSTLIGFAQAGIGAVLRTMRDKQRETISVTDFGAIGDGQSHLLSTVFANLSLAQAQYPNVVSLTQELNNVAIQAAIDAVALAGGGNLYFPPGTYIVAIENPTTLATALIPKAGVIFRGAGRTVSILKLKANQGNYQAIIGSHFATDDCTGFSMFDLCVDQNSANNAVASAADFRATTVDGIQYFRGRYAVYVRAGQRMTIEHCRFTNITARNSIIFRQASYGGVQYVTVARNIIDNVGGIPEIEPSDDTPAGEIEPDFDVSTIYFELIHGVITENIIKSAGAGSNGSRTGIEIHGGDIKVTKNEVVDYLNGMNVSGVMVYAGVQYPSVNQHIHGNTFSNCIRGLRIYSWESNNPAWVVAGVSTPVPSTVAMLQNCTISENVVTLNRAAWAALGTAIYVQTYDTQIKVITYNDEKARLLASGTAPDLATLAAMQATYDDKYAELLAALLLTLAVGVDPSVLQLANIANQALLYAATFYSATLVPLASGGQIATATATATDYRFGVLRTNGMRLEPAKVNKNVAQAVYKNLKIINNTISHEGAGIGTDDVDDKGAGLELRLTDITLTHEAVEVRGNTITGALGAGIKWSLNSRGSSIVNNTIVNPGQSTAIADVIYKSGIAITGTQTALVVDHNTLIDTAATSGATTMQHGIVLAPAATTECTVRKNTLSTLLTTASLVLVTGNNCTGVFLDYELTKATFVAPTNPVAVGSRIFEKSAGNLYIQTTAPNGTTWTVPPNWVTGLTWNLASRILKVSNSTESASIHIDRPAAKVGDLQWMTSGVARWVWRVTSTAEGGSNAGSNLQLLARDDSGNALATPLTLTRSTGWMYVGGNVTPTSSLHLGGSIATAVTAYTAAHTLGSTDSLTTEDASGGDYTVALPAAGSCIGREYWVQRIGATGTITIQGNSGQLINGSNTQTLTVQWQSAKLKSTGLGWVMIKV